MTLANIGKIVVSLLALGGSWLLNIEPPLEFSHYINGFVQLVCILIAFFILKMNKSGQLFLKKLFIVSAGLFIILGFVYYWQYVSTVRIFQEEKIIRGTRLSSIALEHCNSINGGKAMSKLTCEDRVLEDFEQYTFRTKKHIWENFLPNQMKMMALYFLLVASFIIAAFSIIDFRAEIKALQAAVAATSG